MKESAVLKTCSDICFVLGLFCLFAPLGSFLWPLLALSVACLADGILLCRIKNAALRIVLSLLPALCLLMAHSAIQYIAMGVALLYFFVFTWSGMPSMKIWTYRGFFTAFVCVGVVVLAVALIAGFAVMGSVVFFFLFLILGALALRLMRMGASMSLKWNVSNMGSFVAPVLISIAAAVVVYFVLLGIVWLLGQVIVPYAGKAERPSYTSAESSKMPVPLNQSTFQSLDDYDRLDEIGYEPAKRNIADVMREYPYIKYIVLGVAATAEADGVDSAVTSLYVVELDTEFTVKVYRTETLAANWELVAEEKMTITSDGTEIRAPLPKGVDMSSGFFKVEIE